MGHYDDLYDEEHEARMFVRSRDAKAAYQLIEEASEIWPGNDSMKNHYLDLLAHLKNEF